MSSFLLHILIIKLYISHLFPILSLCENETPNNLRLVYFYTIHSEIFIFIETGLHVRQKVNLSPEI